MAPTPSTSQKRTAGINVPAPTKTCTDPRCPFHGNLRVHGRSFTGVVTSAKATRTVTVLFSWKHLIPKYERFQTRRTSVKAHSPPCLDPREGMTVTVMETRPLSKTKNFVVVQINDATTIPNTQEHIAAITRSEKTVLKTSTQKQKSE